jgi:hypothetical protein
MYAGEDRILGNVCHWPILLQKSIEAAAEQ